MALTDLQRIVAGMFTRPQPQPGASMFDQARADAQAQALSQLGMGLVAAAVPQTPLMRAQALQTALGSIGNMGTNVYNAAQARLMSQQAEAAAARDRRIAERASAILGGNAPEAAPISAPIVSQQVAPTEDFRAAPSAAAQRIAAPAPPTAAPMQFTDAERTRLENAAAIGDEEVIKVYSDIVESRSKPQRGEFLGMQVMKMPDGSYAYVQPSKTGEPPVVLGPAPAPGEEERAVVEAKAKGEIMAFQPKATRAIARTESNAANVMGAVSGALEILRRSPGSVTGKTGKLASKIPGTDAYQLDRYLDTIKANVGFGELQAMREASPTGGALGQVAVQELENLQATKGSLDVGQKADSLEQSLLNIAADTDGLVNSTYDAYERDYGTGTFERDQLYDMGIIYAVPDEAVQILRDNADSRDARRAFDRQFGKGASKFYLGVE